MLDFKSYIKYGNYELLKCEKELFNYGTGEIPMKLEWCYLCKTQPVNKTLPVMWQSWHEFPKKNKIKKK